MHIFDLGCDVLGMMFLNHDLYFVHHVIMHVCKKFNRSINNLYYIEIYKRHLSGHNLYQCPDIIRNHDSNGYLNAKKRYIKVYRYLVHHLYRYDLRYLFDIYPWLVNRCILYNYSPNIVIPLERIKYALRFKPNSNIYIELFISCDFRIIKYLFESIDQCDRDISLDISSIFAYYVVNNCMSVVKVYAGYSYKYWISNDVIQLLYDRDHFDIIKILMSNGKDIEFMLDRIVKDGCSGLLTHAYDTGYRNIINAYLNDYLPRNNTYKSIVKLAVSEGLICQMFSINCIIEEIVKDNSYDRDYLNDIAVLFK